MSSQPGFHFVAGAVCRTRCRKLRDSVLRNCVLRRQMFGSNRVRLAGAKRARGGRLVSLNFHFRTIFHVFGERPDLLPANRNSARNVVGRPRGAHGRPACRVRPPKERKTPGTGSGKTTVVAVPPIPGGDYRSKVLVDTPQRRPS